MKYFVILLVLIGTVSIMIPTSTYGMCISGTDWDEVPCWGRTVCPDDDPCSKLEWWQNGWMPYYDYKGAEWMEMKKAELLEAIKSGTLQEWKKLTPNQAHDNVHDYYFYMEDVPNHNGIYVEQYIAGYFPPLKQTKAGINPDEIECRVDLVLIQKHDGSPACIFSESIQKLVERGWIGNIIKIDPKIMNAIEAASIKKYALEPEFKAQRDIAKEIFKSLSAEQDIRYIAFGLGDDRKSLDLYVDNTTFTVDKNQQYYENIIHKAFTEVTVPINVIFVEGSAIGSTDE